MFDKQVYKDRRNRLRKKIDTGILLLPGNDESAMNYPANTYHYRQDSSFLYYFGLDHPGFHGFIDIDNNEDYLYGDDFTIDDIIWMGDQPTVKELALKAGVEKTKPVKNLHEDIRQALRTGRKIHLLPPYRGDHYLWLSRLLEVHPDEVKDFVSPDFIQAVVSMREIKDEHEIQQIEQAVDVCYKMHTTVMKKAFPGTWEREIAGAIEGISLSHGNPVSFPVILSINGQILHNHYHGNMLKEGRLLVTDAGAESPMHYAGDITRTVPVGGKFNDRQRAVYETVLKANTEAIAAAKPGIRNLDLHLMAAGIIVDGLKDVGLMKGNTEDAVREGAHALFFPHGLGHMMGLDVHDMEGLGENFVGYNEELERSGQFGLAALRLGKELREGFVITVEPGIYFIPALIDLWKKDKKHQEFINYDKVETYRDFGGIRIEDDILITSGGYRILGRPIPKTPEEIEETMASGN